jgi:hypothetical protein
MKECTEDGTEESKKKEAKLFPRLCMMEAILLILHKAIE